MSIVSIFFSSVVFLQLEIGIRFSGDQKSNGNNMEIQKVWEPCLKSHGISGDFKSVISRQQS